MKKSRALEGDQEIFERLNEAPKLLKPLSLPEASWKSSRSRCPKLGPNVGSVLAVVLLCCTEKKRGDSLDGLDKLNRNPSCWFPMSAGNPSRIQSKKRQSLIHCSRSNLNLLTILYKSILFPTLLVGLFAYNRLLGMCLWYWLQWGCVFNSQVLE